MSGKVPVRDLCPVCRNDVKRTIKHNIGAHFDKISETCPGSGQPFYITIRKDPEYQGVTE